MYKQIIRPLLFQLSPETIHHLVVLGLRILHYIPGGRLFAFQQCRYYEVDNIFEYMVETYINGNFSTFRELYHELNKEARKDFIGFLLVECSPQYHIEILQKTV